MGLKFVLYGEYGIRNDAAINMTKKPTSMMTPIFPLVPFSKALKLPSQPRVEFQK